jgi:RNA polymerase sigma-70 factor, ECF subfamily
MGLNKDFDFACFIIIIESDLIFHSIKNIFLFHTSFISMESTKLDHFDENDEIHELILAGKAGDRDAMSLLVTKFSASVHNLIFSIIRDGNVVQDLAQETFVRMLLSIDKYEFRAPFRSWLFRIAVNLCRDHMRKNKVRRIITRFQIDKETGEEQTFIDAEQDPTRIVHESERMQIIIKALGKISDSSRIVFVLREMKDLSYEEISESLGWKIGTVKSRLFRARRELAELLGPQMEELR